MGAHFTLTDQTTFARVYKFDGIFDGNDVTFNSSVDVIDHACQRG